MLNSFIEKSNHIHNNKYDYSKAKYLNSKTKIVIICPVHGEFKQTPTKHTSGRGCFKCFADRRYGSKKKFIEKSNHIHNNKYDYSNVEYVNNKTKVEIICPVHGEFKQNPKEHHSGQGCPSCSMINRRSKDYIIKFNNVHNNKYDYSKVEYINSNIKITIICPTHGEFEQLPRNHLDNKECPECAVLKKRITYGDFVDRSNEIHKNKYTYNKDFEKTKDKTTIGCVIHENFEQEVNSHLNGHGCPKCNSSSGEKIVRDHLENLNINYIEQKTFDGCKLKNKLSFDFYLPELNTIIEYDGIQHFKPVEFFGGYTGFRETKKRDYIKNEYCEINDIKLIRVPYYVDISDFIDNLF